MNEVICIGMAVTNILAKGVKQIRFGGHTEFVESVSMAVGGDALTQAIVISKLGHQVGLYSMVGMDLQGSYLLNTCKEQGIDVNNVIVSELYPTSTSMVLVTEDGERSFISHKGGTVDEFCLPESLLSRIERDVKIVSIGSLFCSPKFDHQIGKLLRTAKDAGALTIADMVPNRGVIGLKEVKSALPFLDYIVPSKEEALLYTEKGNVKDAAEMLMDYGVSNVIVKQGADGAFVLTSESSYTVPVFPSNVVDTTGAGDNFMAGFISGLLRNYKLNDCLELASATASVSIGSIGATTGVNTFEQIQEVMREKGSYYRGKIHY